MNAIGGFIGLGAFFVLMALQVPVAISMVFVSFTGIWLLYGMAPAIGVLAGTPYELISSWTLSAVPMFLLMGFIAYYSKLTVGMFDAAKVALQKVPGGLGIAAIVACSGFAAVCGSSLATSASMGRISIPEMVKAGYKPGFAAGALAAGGTIGALIPPSIMMIIYGVFAETSVTKLFVGGMTVGIMTAISYVVVIGLVARYRKDIIPATSIGLDQIDGPAALKAVVPIILLILLIFGGLFSGLFTATEAGAVGAAGSILLAAVAGRLSWVVIRSSVLDTLGTCSSLFFVGIGAVMFTKFLGLSGVAGIISGAAQGPGLDYLTLMFIIVVIYLVLGMFMEPFGAMLVTLPVLLPILHAHNLDLVWFGVFVVKMLEIGMITPPLGMNVFVIRNVASEYTTLPEIFRGVALFLAADMVVVLLIVLFPSIVVFLPSLLR